MFKGEKVEDFRLALTILDDVWVMRSNMFEFVNLTDNANKTYDRVPDYEPLITKMRIGIRANGYFSDVYTGKELQLMEGQPLNDELRDVFQRGVAQRDSDILNVVRHSDLNFAYNQQGKLVVLAKDKTEAISDKKIIQNLKNEIKIMISTTEDPIGQLNLWQYYNENKHQGKEFLENMLSNITNGAFVFA